jgi:hypothetical protein
VEVGTVVIQVIATARVLLDTPAILHLVNLWIQQTATSQVQVSLPIPPLFLFFFFFFFFSFLPFPPFLTRIVNRSPSSTSQSNST